MKSTEIDFSRPDTSREWFRRQKPELLAAMAIRAALRGLPLTVDAVASPDFQDIILVLFRSSFVVVVANRHSNIRNELKLSHFYLPTYQAAKAMASITGYGAYGLSLSAAINAAEAAYSIDPWPVETRISHAATEAALACQRSLAVFRPLSSRGASDMVTSIAIDAGIIEEANLSPANLLNLPLWNTLPSSIITAWSRLKQRLLQSNADWDVWVRWYEDVLAGHPSLGYTFDLAVASLPDVFWKQVPAAINARIKELIAEHTLPELIPIQGAGPHFVLSPDLQISLAPPSEIDVDGNNLDRIRQLLPQLRQAAADLASHVNPNTHPELARILADYRAAIAGEPETIAWGTVFGLGVRLENAASAAWREIANRLQEPLEDAAQEALDSVLTLHGPLVLATKEGRDLSEQADQFRLTREEQAALREAAQTVAEALRNSNLADPPAAKLTEEAAETIGEGHHPERSTVFGLATVGNLATVLLPSALLGVLAGIMGGGAGVGIFAGGFQAFRQSKRFDDAAKVLGGGLDSVLATLDDQAELVKAQAVARLRLLIPFRDFVTRNEQPLRQIAENSTQLRWALRYIDLIVRINPPAQ